MFYKKSYLDTLERMNDYFFEEKCRLHIELNNLLEDKCVRLGKENDARLDLYMIIFDIASLSKEQIREKVRDYLRKTSNI